MNTFKIANILLKRGLEGQYDKLNSLPILQRLSEKIQHREPLTFLLPAFPAKSPCKKKTIGKSPDLGEVVALKNLEMMCQEMASVYPPGAEVVICSDGRVFSDVVEVSDRDIDDYHKGILEIVNEYKLSNLKVLSMDDLFPSYAPNELREILLNLYCDDLSTVREKVVDNEKTRGLFNGLHRFLIEDQRDIFPELSKNAFQKMMKKKAYELLRRSDGWSKLIDEYFKDGLRLSIHPHPIGHSKFGIRLVDSKSRWATPWHNVLVKFNDREELMHHSDALKLGAELKFERSRYAYFEAPAV